MGKWGDIKFHMRGLSALEQAAKGYLIDQRPFFFPPAAIGKTTIEEVFVSQKESVESALPLSPRRRPREDNEQDKCKKHRSSSAFLSDQTEIVPSENQEIGSSVGLGTDQGTRVDAPLEPKKSHKRRGGSDISSQHFEDALAFYFAHDYEKTEKGHNITAAALKFDIDSNSFYYAVSRSCAREIEAVDFAEETVSALRKEWYDRAVALYKQSALSLRAVVAHINDEMGSSTASNPVGDGIDFVSMHKYIYG